PWHASGADRSGDRAGGLVWRHQRVVRLPLRRIRDRSLDLRRHRATFTRSSPSRESGPGPSRDQSRPNNHPATELNRESDLVPIIRVTHFLAAPCHSLLPLAPATLRSLLRPPVRP